MTTKPVNILKCKMCGQFFGTRKEYDAHLKACAGTHHPVSRVYLHAAFTWAGDDGGAAWVNTVLSHAYGTKEKVDDEVGAGTRTSGVTYKYSTWLSKAEVLDRDTCKPALEEARASMIEYLGNLKTRIAATGSRGLTVKRKEWKK